MYSTPLPKTIIWIGIEIEATSSFPYLFFFLCNELIYLKLIFNDVRCFSCYVIEKNYIILGILPLSYIMLFT